MLGFFTGDVFSWLSTPSKDHFGRSKVSVLSLQIQDVRYVKLESAKLQESIPARFLRWSSVILLVAIVLSASNALGSTISVGIGAFGPGSTLTTFMGLADGTEVNGLTVNGILFNYSLGNGQVTIDGGPGTTNNIAPPNIVSVGNNTGVLSMTLPSSVDMFGYGYAVLNTGAVTAATTISLF